MSLDDICAFGPCPEHFLLFLSARQEHHSIFSQLNCSRFWLWKANPTAGPNTRLGSGHAQQQEAQTGPKHSSGSPEPPELLFPHPQPSSRPESSSSPQSFPPAPPRRSYTHATCVQSNFSVPRSPIPVCFSRAKSSIPLGFFFICCLCSGSSPALREALCPFTVVISYYSAPSRATAY